MSPDIEVMRQWVSDMYKGERWKKRVKNMPDSQVTAIYLKKQTEVVKETKKKSEEPDIPF
jgi:hypothetical protein